MPRYITASLDVDIGDGGWLLRIADDNATWWVDDDHPEDGVFVALHEYQDGHVRVRYDADSIALMEKLGKEGRRQIEAQADALAREIEDGIRGEAEDRATDEALERRAGIA